MKQRKCLSSESKPLKKYFKGSCVKSRLPKRWATIAITLEKIKKFQNNLQSTLKMMVSCTSAVKAVGGSLTPMSLLSIRKFVKKFSSKNVRCSTLPLRDKSKQKEDSTSPHQSVTQ